MFLFGISLALVGLVILFLFGGVWWKSYWNATHPSHAKYNSSLAMAECQGGVQTLKRKALIWGGSGLVVIIVGIGFLML